MTMTINEYFDQLLERVNLKIDDEGREMIEKKQNALREALRAKLSLKDDFLTGSYRRHTIIKPKDGGKFDVDIFVAFDKEEYGEKELAELRTLVANALQKIKEENSELGISNVNDTQRRSVCVEFGNNFRIDVVPAIEIEKDKMYKIFDRRTLKAVKSNPKLHASLLSEANDRTGGKLVPIIKILKGWKRVKCDYVKSFHIEMLAREILGGGEIKSYAEGVAKFFKDAGAKLQKASLKDPANNEHYIDAYLDDDGKRQEILGLVAVEAETATRAMEIAESGKGDPVKEWQQVFEDDEASVAEAIKSGSFSLGAGGVQVGGITSHATTINSPKSWGEQ